ncbi:hypothetical protein EV191_102517 [Tamaricihabitans halophyticus]|uniref:DUF485 domain-containing protein n=1 Tax=Tamaricihabitans halophyticus TaxID=1262583 RepID=A0A4R2R7C7_9PSEU|nr:hypothetical protein [Tamaricihabitans halophyticus]TCP55305.1 hypothetical protein EV191_102517 [Tamaricihabitans halophyticus]
MAGAKRVTVMSPSTRLAHARRRVRGRWRVPRLDPADAERALALYRAQRARGVAALVLLAALLFGLPVLLSGWATLEQWRLVGIPMSWLALLVPYPVMMLLAAWQLRRAERIEDS